MINIASLGLR